jgi:hypothetical protein
MAKKRPRPITEINIILKKRKPKGPFPGPHKPAPPGGKPTRGPFAGPMILNPKGVFVGYPLVDIDLGRKGKRRPPKNPPPAHGIYPGALKPPVSGKSPLKILLRFKKF